MGPLRTIAIVVITISLLTFVALFGRLPAFRNTPIGFLHKVIWIRIPHLLSRVDSAVTGGRLSSSLSQLGYYLLYKKHPIVLIFFLGLIAGCASLFLPSAWPDFNFTQKLTILLLLPGPFFFAYLCQKSTASSPHLITPATHAAHIRHYPYDHILYHADNICRTCQLPKPARSKHCSLCNTCVARSDHHCIWVNNCLGYGNYKFFLALLVSVSALLFYGSYLAYVSIAPEVAWHMREYPEWHQRSYDGRDDLFGKIMFLLEGWSDALGTAVQVGGLSRGGVGFLCTLTAPLPFGLLVYHVYLIWAGMTTNESAKWGEWKEDMLDGLVFKADVKKSEVYGEAEEGEASSTGENTMKDSERIEYAWPVRSRQFLVRTGDGQQPRNVQPQIERLIVKDSWVPCWRLGDVENIYDQGFWKNLVEVLRF